MAKTYGNVFKIWFSTDLCIVLNDYESMKKAFSNDVYSGRMKGTISDLFIGNNGKVRPSLRAVDVFWHSAVAKVSYYNFEICGVSKF